MKKSIYVFMLSSAIFAASCSQNEDLDKNIKEQTEGKAEAICISSEGVEPESVTLRLISEKPEYYIFEDPNSDLWKAYSDNGLKSTTSAVLTTIGYDTKVSISSSKASFIFGLKCDTRVRPGVYYLYTRYQYKKMINIPKGATLILPPVSVMSAMYPMGIKPGTSSTTGYTCVLISSNSTQDTYYLVAEGNEITYNALGQQVAPGANPVFFPCGKGLPNNFLFKYQYQVIEW
jgi:hypothetical protein